MTLKEKINDALFYIEPKESITKCVQIADDFAIGFGEWLIKKEHEYTNKIIAMEELLEIYKKEKGL